MKKVLIMALLALVGTTANAEDSKTSKENKNKPVFTVVKENKITSIKNQSRSGTCWDYSTLSFFESEILKKSGKTYDLCEMFVANKTYMDRATMAVRMHGDVSFSQGGSAFDPLYCIQHYGIVPENAMPLPGTLYGDSLANFSELFSVMTPYVESVAKNKNNKLSTAWKSGLQGILDAYLGKCPEKFMYEGKSYTPQSFAASLGLNWDDYVTFTSYTHHPMWTQFAVEVQDNWRWPLSWNVPIDDLCRIIDNAINNGYTVAWGGDVSEDGFTRSGLGLAYNMERVRDMSGTDADRWLKFTKSKKRDVVDSLGISAPEVVPTQKMRQEAFDNWETTDDHGMHIFGIAKDQNGKEYYMVKNSWGETGDYKGIWYMSKAFVAYKTMDFMVNKNAVPQDIRKKLKL
ncbi:peptidase C1-like family protein [Prevotella sp. DNF00663]|uniref:aminopeptidase C n=1 Tax=unclassified Prevotella TaxID=2638335 RepID=UPI000513EE91|nr:MULTISPECIES: C1 family peptidase [unclassified Prevotella]KGI59726.1 aminopeptidase [Prevotella sp. S7 MS 2]KXB85256.1 peptidase C1-like family protein [Prevotella sp. DNF00663]